MILEKVKEQNVAMNRLWSKRDELYHTYAAHCGFSAAAFWVLYSLCETDQVYTQNMLAERWCFPKQTVHSAIAGLVKTGYVRLEQLAGPRNSKAVTLTEKGADVGMRMIKPLLEAGQRALLKLSEQERQQFLDLTEKQYRLLQAEIDSVYQDETDSRLSLRDGNRGQHNAG